MRFDAIWDRFYPCGVGYYVVRNKDNKVGIITPLGKWMLEPEWDNIQITKEYFGCSDSSCIIIGICNYNTTAFQKLKTQYKKTEDIPEDSLFRVGTYFSFSLKNNKLHGVSRLVNNRKNEGFIRYYEYGKLEYAPWDSAIEK